jgi:hypothetical protein
MMRLFGLAMPGAFAIGGGSVTNYGDNVCGSYLTAHLPACQGGQ